MLRTVYLAGPFFNPAQLDLIREVEDLLIEAGQHVFSPRQTAESNALRDNPKNPDLLRAVFERNRVELERCDWVFAVLDWLMPVGHELVRLEPEDPMKSPPVGKVTPVRIPDSGTVWELGYANARQKPVLGFTVASTLNLMLTQSCAWICTDRYQVAHVLRSLATNWKGDHL